MCAMTSKFNRFLADESAAVSIEYALIAVILSVSITGVLRLLAPQINSIFLNVSQNLGK